MIKQLDKFLDDRTGYRRIVSALLIEDIPGGAKWRYVWGSALAFVFSIQLITGILLMTAYSAGANNAWASVRFIQYEMDFGWLIRGLHHFGSQTMVVLLAIHMLQVVIAGAHLKPREVNWWLGLMLLGAVLGLSLTGYLLPWDQKGYWATQVATNIAGNVPVIGPWIQKIAIGGPSYGHHTLTRFFTLHVGVLPPTVVFLVVLHLAVFRRHGVTVSPKAEGKGWFWPDQAFRDMVVSMIVFGVMLAAVMGVFGKHGIAIGAKQAAVAKADVTPNEQVVPQPEAAKPQGDEPDGEKATAESQDSDQNSGQNPGSESSDSDVAEENAIAVADVSAWDKFKLAGRYYGWGANLDAPADPSTEYPARPEWYFLFLFQSLKYFEGSHTSELIGTVGLPTAVGMVLFLLPLLGYGRMRAFGRAVGVLTVVGLLGGVIYLTVMAFASDDSKLARKLNLGDAAVEAAEEFESQQTTAHRAAVLAVKLADGGVPASGPRDLLKRDPATRGKELFGQYCASCHNYGAAFTKATTASDLGVYGSEEWAYGVITKPSDPKYFGNTELKTMIDWAEDNLGDDLEEDELAELRTIATWLSWGPTKNSAKKDDPRFETAIELFAEDAWGCATCHAYDGKGGGTGPELTGWGNANWIRGMIMSPNHPARYGESNSMPAFRDMDAPDAQVMLSEMGKRSEAVDIVPLSVRDRELIIRFMTDDKRLYFDQ